MAQRDDRDVTRLVDARDAWLDSALAGLRADARVLAVWLVGSLGRGDADAWSDVDLIVVTDDDHLGALLADDVELGSFGDRVLAPVEDLGAARVRNGATFLSATYVQDGLPLWVDWHVHARSVAARPSDGAVAFERIALPATTNGFSEVVVERGVDRGPTRRQGRAPGDEDRFHMGLIPHAAKRLARQGPDAAIAMFDLIGASATAVSPAGVLTTLRTEAARCAPACEERAVGAVYAHLDLVEGCVG